MNKASRPIFLQRKLVQGVLRTLHSLVVMFPSELKVTTFEGVYQLTVYVSR